MAALLLFVSLGVTIGGANTASAEIRRRTGLVSVANDGSALATRSITPAVSGTGRFTAFATAQRIDASDTDAALDIYVRDVVAGTTTWASRDATALEYSDPQLSFDGRYLVFIGGLPESPFTNIFVVDRGAPAAGGTFDAAPSAPSALPGGRPLHNRDPSISADGSQIAFMSWAPSTTGAISFTGLVHVHDRDRDRDGALAEGPADEATIDVPAPNGAFEPEIAAGGLHVVLVAPAASAGGAPVAHVYDRALDESAPTLDAAGNTRLSEVTSPTFTTMNGSAPRPQPLAATATAAPDISADGRVVTYAFSYERGAATSSLPPHSQVIAVERGPSGAPAAAAVISAIADMALADGAGDDGSYRPRISDDGRYVTFVSEATNFAEVETSDFSCDGADSGETCQAYVVDRGAPTAERRPVGVSFTPFAGSVGDAPTRAVDITASGNAIVMETDASNLTGPDTNDVTDVVLLEWTPSPTATPDPVGFADASVGSVSAPVTVTITHDDFGPWDLSTVVPTGQSGDFLASVPTCAGGSLHAGEGCTLTVQFAPTDVGARNAGLRFSNTRLLDWWEDELVVELQGSSAVPIGNGLVERVSRSQVPDGSGGFELDAHSETPALSANGRYVAFETSAKLDPRDLNGVSDIYVHDRLRDTISIVSLRGDGTNPPAVAPPSGGTPDFGSYTPSISGDGRFVAFASDDEKLPDPVGPSSTHGPINDNVSDVYRIDRGAPDANGDFTAPPALSVASVGPDGAGFGVAAFDPSISGDGSQVAFTVERGGRSSSAVTAGAPTTAAVARDAIVVLIRDYVANSTVGVDTEEIHDPRLPAMSADGNAVAFLASTLVASDGVNSDVFEAVVNVYDRDTDGDGIRDEPGSTRVVGVTVADYTPLQGASDDRLHPLQGTSSSRPAIDGDGSTVAYEFSYEDPTIESPLPVDVAQVVVVDRDPGTGLPIAAEVASTSGPGPLAETAGDHDSITPDVSDDGRYVTFATLATNLHRDEPAAPSYDEDGTCDSYDGEEGTACDVLVVDRTAPGNAGAPQLAHPSSGDVGPDGESVEPVVSGDGRFVAFSSDATNILADDVDANDESDVFVREWTPDAVASPATIDFGDSLVGSLAGLPVPAAVGTLQFGPVPVQSAEIVGGSAADFAVASVGNCAPNVSLAPAAPVTPVPSYAIVHLDTPCVTGVTFTPTAAGARSAVLRVVLAAPFSDDPVQTVDVELVGRGTVPIPPEVPPEVPPDEPNAEPGEEPFMPPDIPADPPGPAVIDIQPTSIDFGDRIVTVPSRIETVTIRNSGGSPLEIGEILLGGATPGDYRIVTTNCSGASLAPGATCEVRLVFVPTAPGERSAELRITSISAGSPHVVRLAGRAPAPTLFANPGVVIPSRATEVFGENWAPLTQVRISTAAAGSDVRFPESAVVSTDAAGRFSVPILLFPRASIGHRTVIAAAAPSLTAQAPLLVVVPSINGPDFVVRG